MELNNSRQPNLMKSNEQKNDGFPSDQNPAVETGSNTSENLNEQPAMRLNECDKEILASSDRVPVQADVHSAEASDEETHRSDCGNPLSTNLDPMKTTECKWNSANTEIGERGNDGLTHCQISGRIPSTDDSERPCKRHKECSFESSDDPSSVRLEPESIRNGGQKVERQSHCIHDDHSGGETNVEHHGEGHALNPGAALSSQEAPRWQVKELSTTSAVPDIATSGEQILNDTSEHPGEQPVASGSLECVSLESDHPGRNCGEMKSTSGHDSEGLPENPETYSDVDSDGPNDKDVEMSDSMPLCLSTGTREPLEEESMSSVFNTTGERVEIATHFISSENAVVDEQNESGVNVDENGRSTTTDTNEIASRENVAAEDKDPTESCINETSHHDEDTVELGYEDHKDGDLIPAQHTVTSKGTNMDDTQVEPTDRQVDNASGTLETNDHTKESSERTENMTETFLPNVDTPSSGFDACQKEVDPSENVRTGDDCAQEELIDHDRAPDHPSPSFDSAPPETKDAEETKPHENSLCEDIHDAMTNPVGESSDPGKHAKDTGTIEGMETTVQSGDGNVSENGSGSNNRCLGCDSDTQDNDAVKPPQPGGLKAMDEVGPLKIVVLASVYDLWIAEDVVKLLSLMPMRIEARAVMLEKARDCRANEIRYEIPAEHLNVISESDATVICVDMVERALEYKAVRKRYRAVINVVKQEKHGEPLLIIDRISDAGYKDMMQTTNIFTRLLQLVPFRSEKETPANPYHFHFLGVKSLLQDRDSLSSCREFLRLQYKMEELFNDKVVELMREHEYGRGVHVGKYARETTCHNINPPIECNKELPGPSSQY